MIGLISFDDNPVEDIKTGINSPGQHQIVGLFLIIDYNVFTFVQDTSPKPLAGLQASHMPTPGKNWSLPSTTKRKLDHNEAIVSDTKKKARVEPAATAVCYLHYCCFCLLNLMVTITISSTQFSLERLPPQHLRVSLLLPNLSHNQLRVHSQPVCHFPMIHLRLEQRSHDPSASLQSPPAFTSIPCPFLMAQSSTSSWTCVLITSGFLTTCLLANGYEQLMNTTINWVR